MSGLKIEDYGFVGNLESGAMIGLNGSVDWLCLPRFDSGALFAALLGEEKNGFWKLAPASTDWTSFQSYRGETLILETTFETAGGKARIIDFMPPRHDPATLIRIMEGLEGVLDFQMKLMIRFDYGRIVPWVRKRAGGISAIAGADALQLYSDISTHGEGLPPLRNFRLRLVSA